MHRPLTGQEGDACVAPMRDRLWRGRRDEPQGRVARHLRRKRRPAQKGTMSAGERCLARTWKASTGLASRRLRLRPRPRPLPRPHHRHSRPGRVRLLRQRRRPANAAVGAATRRRETGCRRWDPGCPREHLLGTAGGGPPANGRGRDGAEHTSFTASLEQPQYLSDCPPEGGRPLDDGLGELGSLKGWLSYGVVVGQPAERELKVLTLAVGTRIEERSRAPAEAPRPGSWHPCHPRDRQALTDVQPKRVRLLFGALASGVSIHGQSERLLARSDPPWTPDRL